MKEKFTISIIFKIISQLILTISNYYIYLNFDINLLGVYFLLISIVDFFFIFFDLGTTTIHFQYSSKKNFEEYFVNFLIIRIVFLLGCILYLTIIFSIFNLWVQDYFQLILILILSKLITLSSYIFLENLRANKKFLRFEIPVFLVGCLKSGLYIYVSFLVENNINDLTNLIYINFYTSILLFIFSIFFSLHSFKIVKPKLKYIIKYVKDARPLMINSFLYFIVINLSNIILGFTLGPVALALISLPIKINSMLEVVGRSIVPLILVLYSYYFSKNKKDFIIKLIYTVENYFSIIFLIVIITVLLNTDIFIALFLPNYKDAILLIKLMIFVPFFYIISTPYSCLMTPAKKQKIEAALNIFKLLLNLFLVIILIPSSFLIFNFFGLGIRGYVFALLIPEILVSFLNRYLSNKYFNIKPQKKIITHFMLAIFSYLIVDFLKNHYLNPLFNNIFILIIISTCLSYCLFLGTLIIFHQIKKEDIKFIFDLLKIKQYTLSIKEEFVK